MVSATLVGAIMGLGVQFYANAIRKVPLMRNPWQHVILAGTGAAFASWVVDFETRTQKELEGACMINIFDGSIINLCFANTL